MMSGGTDMEMRLSLLGYELNREDRDYWYDVVVLGVVLDQLLGASLLVVSLPMKSHLKFDQNCIDQVLLRSLRWSGRIVWSVKVVG